MRANLPGAYWILWTGALINRLGGFLFIFLPWYLTERRAFSLAEAGATVSLYGAGSVLSALFGGILADSIGRKATMILGMSLGASAMLVLSQMQAPAAIVACVFVLGMLTDLYRPAQNAAVADLVPASERLRAYGYLYWAVNLGFSAAAIIAGFLADKNYFYLFAGDAATSLACAAVIVFGVPETRPAVHKDAPRTTWTLPWRDRDFLGFALAQLLMVFVFMQSSTALSLDLRARGIEPSMYGQLISVNGILIVVLQPLALQHLKRVTLAAQLASGALLVALGFGLLAYVCSVPGYLAAIVIWSLGEICFSGAVPAVIAQLAPAASRGRYQGANNMIWATAACLAPLVGSFVLEHFGHFVLWNACFVCAALGAVMHLWIAPARDARMVSVGES